MTRLIKPITFAATFAALAAAVLLIAAGDGDGPRLDPVAAVSPARPPRTPASTTRSPATIRCRRVFLLSPATGSSAAPAADPAYSICYVNAFQTQANEPGTDRPDERSNWPRKLILSKLGDDPNWGGEYLVDVRSGKKRKRAARWVQQMIDGCAEKGFDAVEYDNLDSWTRFDGTPLAKKVPFGKKQALAYARLLAERAHAAGWRSARRTPRT